ncbi:MAG TPA: multiheme c-type cytochrome [Polyangia bacterium]|nr:multiheme c-type cytochrome [Polyangia bacterium]
MPSRHTNTLFVVAGALIAAGTLAARAAGSPAKAAAGERRLTIFYTAEIHGTLEPCGCTSDPLGDVARYAALVRGAAKAGPTLVVDGGGMSFPESSSPKEKPANALRAKFLARTLETLGPPFAAALAETDVADRGGEVVPKRLAVNLSKAAAVAPSRLETVGGVRVGIFGVADPALAPRVGGEAEDPVVAAKREVARLHGAGAELVIALVPLDRPTARRLARAAGPDLVVLGRQVGKGQPRAESVGTSFLVSASDELQRVGRIDLVWRGGGGPLIDAGGPDAAALRRIEIDAQLSRLDEDLARWSSGPGSDPKFVAGKKGERAELQKERAELDRAWTPPAAGSYFTNQLIPLRRSLPRDEKTAAGMRRLDGEIGALNLKTAPPPVPAEPGRPAYVGDAKCGGCHAPALAFWKKTVHATAWQTLVDVNKQNDYRCVGCHVTGYGQVGGTSLGHTNRLRDVQCETCHGPGSIHVAEKGLEEPSAVRRDAPATLCTGCHTEQHSDTFQYQAYLRDVLGPGHGAAARAKLGDGVTGHELRTAALARAKAAGAAEAKKL